MRLQPPFAFSVLRIATVLLGCCAFESSALGQSGPMEDKPYVPSASVVKGTIAALSDSSEEVAALAVRSLADWRQAAAADEIAKLLAVGTPKAVRIEAFHFFSRLGEQAKPHVAAVRAFATEPDPIIRAAVLAVILDAKASAESIEVIRPLLGDTRAEVRSAVARCLGQAGKAAAAHRKALVGAIATSGSSEFKAAALGALPHIGGFTAADIPVLTPLIRDRDAEVRIAAWAAALGGIIEAKAAGAITDEQDKAVRDALLAQWEKEPPEIKAAIIEDVGKNKAAVEGSVAALVKQIRTGSNEIKVSALRVLGKAGEAGREHLALITEHAKDADALVRAAAIAALGALGPEAVKPNVAVVANGLLDPSDTVRDEALLALSAGGEALRNLPYRFRDVYPGASQGVRATLVKALPVIAKVVGIDDDMLARGRAALTDPNPDIRIAMAFVMNQLGAKDGAALLPELLALLKDPEAAARGAAVVALRSFASDAAAKQKLREALRPLLKDQDAEVRWGALDTFHELDPAQDVALVVEIAALLKDEEQSVRAAAARTLGAAGPAAKPHLLEVIRFFNDDPATPPYAAAEAVARISPLTPKELTSLLSPLYVDPEQLPLVRLTAYAASGGDPDGLMIVRLLGRSRAATKDVVKKPDEARASALLEEALKAELIEDKLKAEITTRLAEVKSAQ